MSLLENKQVIHIAVECAVVVVITLYFSIKYKKLNKKVDSLSNRLKEQDDIIQNLQKTISNHEKILLNLVKQNQAAPIPPVPIPPAPVPAPVEPTIPVVAPASQSPDKENFTSKNSTYNNY